MKRRLFLPLLSALFYIAASPPVDIFPLGWLALFPLIYAVKLARDAKEALKLGSFGGILSSIGLYYWLIYTMTSYGGIPVVLSALIFLLLAAYLALYWAVFACLVKRFSGGPLWIDILFPPSLWVSLEYLRTYLFSGFPWALLGYTQTSFPAVIQIADMTAVYGVSFVLALFSTACASGLYRYSRNKTFPLAESACLVACLLIPISYGLLKIDAYGTPEAKVRVALVQGNIEQSIKWEEGERERTVSIYKDLSRKAKVSAGPLDIIVWPETATPFYFQQAGDLREEVLALTNELGSPVLFGSPAYRLDSERVSYLNSAFLIGPGEEGRGVTFGRYDKLHLVPFGEYVPLSKLLFFVNKLTEGIGDFSPGTGVMTLDLPTTAIVGGAQVRLGPLICYEGIFPDLVRQFVNKGANIIVNITNDAWYGRSSAPYQHLSAAAFRSVENGVYMLRAANTGISAIIDPLGRVQQSKALFERGYVTGEAGIGEGGTFYTKYGDLFAWLALVMSITSVISNYRYNIQRKSS